MQRERYRSRTYRPELVARRFVGWGGSLYVIYEANAANLTLREIETDGAGLPSEKLDAARVAYDKGWPNQVRLD